MSKTKDSIISPPLLHGAAISDHTPVRRVFCFITLLRRKKGASLCGRRLLEQRGSQEAVMQLFVCYNQRFISDPVGEIIQTFSLNPVMPTFLCRLASSYGSRLFHGYHRAFFPLGIEQQCRQEGISHTIFHRSCNKSPVGAIWRRVMCGNRYAALFIYLFPRCCFSISDLSVIVSDLLLGSGTEVCAGFSEAVNSEQCWRLYWLRPGAFTGFV